MFKLKRRLTKLSSKFGSTRELSKDSAEIENQDSIENEVRSEILQYFAIVVLQVVLLQIKLPKICVSNVRDCV